MLVQSREALESDIKRQAKEHIAWEEDHKKLVADDLTGFVQALEVTPSECERASPADSALLCRHR